MKIHTDNIGELTYEETDIIFFPEGMLGLPEYKRYLLIQKEETKPFLRLQCIDAPQINFLAIDPAFADPGYKAFVVDSDPDHVFIDQGRDVILLVVCNFASDGSDVSAGADAGDR